MNELTYEHIDINKLPAEVIMQFERYNRQDNSLVLMRYNEAQKVEAVVIIFRTSTNHYVVAGSTEKYSRAGNGKTVAEVGAFIKRHFCRTLLD